jgi:UDP-glucose 4-epimerase
VIDLAEAHILALRKLLDEGESDLFNLGNGDGFSVKEVIAIAKKVTGVDFKVTTVGRREGDLPVLVANTKKAKEVLVWKPKHTNLKTILKSAWKWHKQTISSYKI